MGMENNLWDPERLRIIGCIMERYSKHLAEGHRVRLGLEGDPHSIYRKAEDAPTGTVVSIQRPGVEGGMLRFAVKMDSDDTLIELDNRNVDPTRVWEIDPQFIDEFRGSIIDENDIEVHSNETKERFIDEDYRDETEARFTAIADQLSRVNDVNSDFRATTVSTLRYIAADLLRLSQGEQLEFSQHYADRYDRAVQERDTSNDVLRGSNLRGGKGKSSDDRHDFHSDDVESLVYGDEILESDKLTDTERQ
jgi:hypothetical protein